MELEYWYDRQVGRFLEQLVRAFHGFRYKTGKRNGQDGVLVQVPCQMANRNRQIAAITRNNSENTLLAVPMITVNLADLSPARDRTQSPSHIDTRQVFERAIDPATGQYTGEVGNSYTVERLMPLPFDATITVDLWTSNQDQKFQLMEQILSVIYPGFDIQNSDNPLDWTALTTIMLDEIEWSSLRVPIGTDNEIDVATLTFKLPFWLSPPAKVIRQKVIQQIVANIYDSGDIDPSDEGLKENPASAQLLSQIVVTPGDNQIMVSGSNISLLGGNGDPLNSTGTPFNWSIFLVQYGQLRPAVSQLRLKTAVESTNDIVGTIQLDTQNPNNLLWTVDATTLPVNTMAAITAIIDPLTSAPGVNLPTAANGQRYLLIHDIGSALSTTVVWGALIAKANDIIQFNSGAWTVSFNSGTSASTQYITNLFTAEQLKWDGKQWIVAIDGEYHAGFWRIFL